MLNMNRLLIFLLLIGALVSPAADITLAENGTAAAVIVIPEKAKPVVDFAAKELAKHLKAMTGADFPIMTDPGSKTGIFLGFGEASGFVPDEYVIKAKDGRIDIYGKDAGGPASLFNLFFDNPDKGTLRGVYNFLDSLGVRWLAPGKDGVHIPFRSELRIPEQDIHFIPCFQDRQITDTWNFMQKYMDAKEYTENASELFLWGLRNNASTRNMVPGCHSEHSIGLYKNPEWLAHPEAQQLDSTGKRDPRHSCWTDPFTKEIWLRAVDGYFSGKTPKECGFDLNGYLHSKWPFPFISPNEFMIDLADHYTNHDGRCRCERCNEFRKNHPCADDTEIVWHVLGEIADHVNEKYPGCFISTLVYPPKRLIPQTIRKPKNIRVRLCLPGAIDLLYPEKLEQDMKLLRDWGAFLGAENIPLWIYQCRAAFGEYLPGIPEPYPHLTAKYIRLVKPLCAGMYQENHAMSHTARNLDVYLFLRMIWNPERDVEKELDEYFTLYYGPAAAPAKELFTLLENNWFKLEKVLRNDLEKRSDLGVVKTDKDTARKLAWSQVYSAEEMEKITALAEKILRHAPAGSAYAKRAGLLQKYLVRIMLEERSCIMDKEERRRKLRIPVPEITLSEDFPSEENWSLVQEFKLVPAKKNGAGLKADGSFKLLTANDTLFLRAVLVEPRMSETRTDPARLSGDPGIWKDNCIELFFFAEKSGKFWQIIVNDNNAWSSRTRDRILNRWEQMKDLKQKTERKADGWTAEIAIPLNELKTDKSDLRFNFTRERNIIGPNKTEYSTWSPLATTGNWNNADNYGSLIFEKQTQTSDNK